MRHWFDFLISVLLYCLLVFIARFPTYRFFFTFSLLISSLTYLFRIDPLCYEAGCRKRQLNLVLVFLCLFCALMLFFWSVSACFCCVRFSFFYTKSRNWLGKTSLKWTVLCRVGCKTTTQSVPACHQLMVFICVTCPVMLWLASVLWRCWLGGRKGIQPVKTDWWGAGVVVCLEPGADLHMAQLVTLPLTVSCFRKIQIGFAFLVLADLGSPGKGLLNGCCCCVM